MLHSTQLQNGLILSPWLEVRCWPDADADADADAAVVPVVPALFGTLILSASLIF